MRVGDTGDLGNAARPTDVVRRALVHDGQALQAEVTRDRNGTTHPLDIAELVRCVVTGTRNATARAAGPVQLGHGQCFRDLAVALRAMAYVDLAAQLAAAGDRPHVVALLHALGAAGTDDAQLILVNEMMVVRRCVCFFFFFCFIFFFFFFFFFLFLFLPAFLFFVVFFLSSYPVLSFLLLSFCHMFSCFLVFVLVAGCWEGGRAGRSDRQTGATSADARPCAGNTGPAACGNAAAAGAGPAAARPIAARAGAAAPRPALARRGGPGAGSHGPACRQRLDHTAAGGAGRTRQQAGPGRPGRPRPRRAPPRQPSSGRSVA